MFDKFVIHVGGDKTGSTSIQNSLSLNKEKLYNDFGVLYPLSGWHAELGSVFAHKPEEYVYNVAMSRKKSDLILNCNKIYFDKFTEEVHKFNDAKNVVVSYEGFMNSDQSVLQGIKSYAEKIAKEIVVIAYIRPPISYAISAMSQHVKFGRDPLPGGQPPYPQYKPGLEKLISIFGKNNLIVRKFDRKHLINENIVDDFLSFSLGLHDLNLISDKTMTNSNESLSIDALEYGRSVIVEMQNREILKNYSVDSFYRKIGTTFNNIIGDKIRISNDLASAAIKKFSPDAQFILDNFGIDLSENYDASSVRVYNEKIDKKTIGFVHSYVDFIESTFTFDEVKVDSYCEREKVSVLQSGCLQVPVVFKNNCCFDLVSTRKHPLRASYILKDCNDKEVLRGKRTEIPMGVFEKNKKLSMLLDIDTNIPKGNYKLLVTMVHEHRCWLDFIGLNTVEIKLEVL